MPSPLDMPATRPTVPEPRSVERLADLGRSTSTAIDHALTEAVRHLRIAGATWTDIGARLGVSRQAATKRYGHVDGYGIALCLDRSGPEPVAYLRDEMTGVEFRDPALLASHGALAIDQARTIDQQPDATP